MSPERIVVALTGGPEGEVLLRRGAGIAGRGAGGELHSVYVARPAPGGAPDPAGLARLRALTEQLGGTHHTLTGGRPGAGGARLRARHRRHPGRRRRLAAQPAGGRRSGPGSSDRLVADSGDIDVLMVSHPYARGPRRPATPERPVGRGAGSAGWVLGLAGPVLLTGVLTASRTAPTVAGAGVPRAHRARRPRRRAVAGGRGGAARQRAAQLLLHPAAAHADVADVDERGRAGAVPGRRGLGRLRRGHRRAPVGAGRPGPARGRRAVPAEPGAAAHRARRRRRCWTWCWRRSR